MRPVLPRRIHGVHRDAHPHSEPVGELLGLLRVLPVERALDGGAVAEDHNLEPVGVELADLLGCRLRPQRVVAQRARPAAARPPQQRAVHVERRHLPPRRLVRAADQRASATPRSQDASVGGATSVGTTTPRRRRRPTTTTTTTTRRRPPSRAAAATATATNHAEDADARADAGGRRRRRGGDGGNVVVVRQLDGRGAAAAGGGGGGRRGGDAVVVVVVVRPKGRGGEGGAVARRREERLEGGDRVGGGAAQQRHRHRRLEPPLLGRLVDGVAAVARERGGDAAGRDEEGRGERVPVLLVLEGLRVVVEREQVEVERAHRRHRVEAGAHRRERGALGGAERGGEPRGEAAHLADERRVLGAQRVEAVEAAAAARQDEQVAPRLRVHVVRHHQPRRRQQHAAAPRRRRRVAHEELEGAEAFGRRRLGGLDVPRQRLVEPVVLVLVLDLHRRAAAGAAAADDDEAAAARVAGAASCDVDAEVEAAGGPSSVRARFGAGAAASAADAAAAGAAASRRTARQRSGSSLRSWRIAPRSTSRSASTSTRGMPRQRARSSVAATSGWKSCHSSPACHCHRGPRSVSTVPARFFLSSATASPGMRWCTAPAGWTCSHLSSQRGRTSVGLPPRDVSMTPPSPSGATTHCTRLTYANADPSPPSWTRPTEVSPLSARSQAKVSEVR